MNNVVISVENLSKRYTIGHSPQYQTIRDTISNGIGSVFSCFRKSSSSSKLSEDFWALNEVSFNVKQGQVVGIIGRNGAGKSTLLKILSRITEPTKGSIKIRGRVASLLEVGTGFHPELSGRENVFLNGAILGMSRAEIRSKFDEIVSFAEVERFLDTPVKHYSSGMYVRLAFSVAAHLEPDILIVDEVLAVGDAGFQAKCTKKIQSHRSSGRTVLVVSHNLPLIQSICDSGLLLQAGKTAGVVSIDEATTNFLRSITVTPTSGETAIPNHRSGISTIEYLDASGKPAVSLTSGDKCSIILTCESNNHYNGLRVTIAFTDSGGQRVFALASFHHENAIDFSRGTNRLKVDFQLPLIFSGSYALDIGVYSSLGEVVIESYGAGYVTVSECTGLHFQEIPRSGFGVIQVDSTWTPANPKVTN